MQTRSKHFKKRASGRIALSAAIAAILASGAAPFTLAQDDDELEEITVTGSRIARTSNFTAPVPITTVTPGELSNLQPGTTLSAQLDTLPQFFNTRTVQNASAGNGGSSIAGSPTASLNLRNLGGTRTLVLLDGRRVVPSDKRGTVNIDLFPSALMRSVDVVTGGASAAYGADAIGGVVNFVLDREFEGLRMNVGVGQHEGGIGDSQQFEIAGGTSFMDDRLHVIASAQSNEIDEIAPNWRNYDSFDFVGHVRNPEWEAWRAANPTAPLSSAPVPRRLTRPQVSSTQSSPLGLIVSRGPNNANPFAPPTALHNMRFTEDGTGVVPFQFGDYACQGFVQCTVAAQSGGPEFQYRERGFDRNVGPSGNGVVTRSGLLGAQYDVNERLQVFWQGIAGRTESIREDGIRFAPALAESLDWAPTIFQDNAFLPASVRQTMISNGIQSFRLSKVGSLTPFQDAGAKERSHDVYTTWNWSTGFDYTIPGVEWDLSASYQKGQSHRNSQIYDKLRLDRLYLASDAVVDPATGNIVCRVQLFNPTPEQLAASVAGRNSGLGVVSPFVPPTTDGKPTPGNNIPLKSPIGLDNTVSDCVPLSLMGGRPLTQEQLDYIHTYKAAKGYVDQDFAEILLTGNLHEGWGAGPIDFAFGLTWRDQQFIEGGYPTEVAELGPAINVPSLGIQGMPTGGGSTDPSLHFLSGVPSVAGQMDVWEWFAETNVPVFDRGSQNLVANLAYRRSDYDRSGSWDSWKLGLNLQVIEDLRLRLTRSADVREPAFFQLFDFQGNAAIFQDPLRNRQTTVAGQFETGMQNLKPETADTLNIGAVWEPSFAPWLDGLQFSVDWYEVEVEDAVQTIGPQRIVDECQRGVQAMCDLVTRNPLTQQVTSIVNPYVNLAIEKVRGWDVEAAYRTEPNFFSDQSESFTVRWLTGIVNERITIVPGGTIPQDASDSLATPDLTSVIMTTYGVGPWSIQLQTQYVDSVRFNIDWVEGIDVDDNSVPSMTWFGMNLAYAGEFDSGSNYTIGFNIQNLFDREPPIRPGFSDFGGNSQTLGPPHEFWGRRYNLNFNYSF